MLAHELRDEGNGTSHASDRLQQAAEPSCQLSMTTTVHFVLMTHYHQLFYR